MKSYPILMNNIISEFFSPDVVLISVIASHNYEIMRRILVPTDFSPNALTALYVAMDIASRSNGLIILYHVYVPVDSPMIGNLEEREEYNANKEIVILKKLQRLSKKALKETNNITISTVVGQSPLINSIIDFADANHIDMIVMGTKGASGIRKVIVGSVATKVSQRASVPVLLIPKNHEREEFGQIVFATDLQESDQEALAFTIELARLVNCAVTVIHLVDSSASDKEQEKEKDSFQTYAYYMQRKFSHFNVKFQLTDTLPGMDKMEALFKEIPYGMLAMVRRRKSFFQNFFSKSDTRSMAYISKKPVLIIPPGVDAPSES